MKTSLRVSLIAAIAAGFISLSASADSLIFYLNDSNVDSLDGPNYLQVTVSDGTTAGTINYQVDVIESAFTFPTSGGNFGMQNFAFNVADTSAVTISNVAPAWAVSTPNNNIGGFGKFSFALDGNGGSRTTLLEFTIIADGDSVNDYNLGAAAHVAGFGASGEDSAWFATANGGPFPDPVPLPAAVWLFGTALLALFGLGRRKARLRSRSPSTGLVPLPA